MIWFFERQRARLHYEIRRETDGPAYELVITHPDGRQEIERYEDPAAIAERSALLQSSLTEDGWQAPPMRVRPRASPPDRY
jgi:hypothetical protein